MKWNRNLYSRVAKLEEKANPEEPPVFLVFLSGEDGLLRRHNEAGELVETLTREQFEALPGRTIYIRPKDESEED